MPANFDRNPCSVHLARRAWLVAAVLALLVAKLIAAFTLRVNSDEPQHLHVVWAWTQGLLPYRDVFDNHAPLFHVLYAPLLSWLGERADIVTWMRCLAIPWYALCLWLCFRLGRALFDRNVGLLGAALLAVQPTFFARSTEFRPDDAWAAAWIAAMVIAVEGPPTPRRSYLCGLLAGLAVALSIKSAILIAAALCAAAIVLLILALEHKAPDWRAMLRVAMANAAGGAVLPVAIAAAFVLTGAANPIFRCLVLYNMAPGLGRWQHAGLNAWAFPLTVLLALLILHVFRAALAQGVRFALQAWVLATGLIYLALRGSYQPLLDRQDVLPLIPMLTPFAAALLVCAVRRWRAAAIAATIALFVIEAAMTIHSVRPWRSDAAGYADELRTLLDLAPRQAFVMDDKAESIFRPRPVYWLLENVTLHRLKTGSIPDDIIDGLIDDRVAVGVFERETGADRAFVDSNYVQVAPHVAVLGQDFGVTGATIDFDIAIAAPYAIVARHGGEAGLLDGTPYDASRVLAAGRHRFVPDHRDEWAIEWARAASMGYSPFAGTQDRAAPSVAAVRHQLVDAGRTH